MKEIFQKIINRQAEGVAIHDLMGDYYDFLQLDGFRCLHRCQFIEEAETLKKLKHYYIKHFGSVPMPSKIDTKISVIPSDWPLHETSEITGTSSKSLTKTGLELYLSWEKETSKFYEECAKKLKENDLLEEYYMVLDLMGNVEGEIHEIKEIIITLQAVDYNVEAIKKIQYKLKWEYKEHKCKL